MNAYDRFGIWFTRSFNTVIRRRPKFDVGDVVRFEPDEQTIGWTQDFGGLSVGYTGTITRVERNDENFWIVYVDNLPGGFADFSFRLVRKADRDSPR